jgi:hypothetical protein
MRTVLHLFSMLTVCCLNLLPNKVLASTPTAAMPMVAASCVNPKLAPYIENFDTSQAYVTPACWSEGVKGTNSWASVVVSNFNAASAPNCLELFNDLSDTTMAITPQLFDLSNQDKQIIFSASTSNISNKLYIGTVSSPTDLGSFVPVDTLSFGASNVYVDKRVRFDMASNYNGTHQYIAFLHGDQVSYTSISIDNFEYMMSANCERPLNLSVNNITDSSAVISSSANGSVFNYSWGPTGFGQASTTANGGNPFTLFGLQPNTEYEAYVQTDCSPGSGDSSAFSVAYTFKTDCAPFSAPYTNNFDQDTLSAPPACWKNLLPGPGFKQVEVYTRSNSFYSAPNHLQLVFPGNSNPTDRAMMITPAFSDLNGGDKQVRFLADAINANVALLVGTMSDPTDPSTFQTIDSIYLVSTSSNINVANYTEYTVELSSINGYNGSDNYVAFQPAPSTTNYSTIYLDNFSYEAIPPCVPPALTSLSISTITDISAMANWTGGAGVKTLVSWGAVGFTPGSPATLGSGSSTGSSYVINGLTSNTAYEYYLQDSCAAGLSYYVGPFEFNTACVAAVAPFYENFDGSSWVTGVGFDNTGDQLDNCWSRTPELGNRYAWGVRTNTSPAFGTGPEQDFSGSGNYLFTTGSYGNLGDTALLYMPLVDISNLNDPFLELYVHRFGSAMGDLYVEMDSGNGVWHRVLNLSSIFSPTGLSPFQSVGLALNTNSNLIQLRFMAIGQGCCEGDMALDEISIKEAPACPDVVNIGFTNLRDTSVTIEWGLNTSAGTYEVWHGPLGFYQGSNTPVTNGTITATSQSSLMIDTLQAATCYQFLVRSLCGTQDTSVWQGPYTFCTSCKAVPTPYYNDFEMSSINSVPDCWGELLASNGSVSVNNTTPFAGVQYLEIYNDFFPSDIIAVSPPLDGVAAGNKQIRLQARTDQAFSEWLIVGTLSNQQDINSFKPLDTLILNTNYQTFTTLLTAANGYNGTDQYIGLKHGLQNSFERISVDDFHVEDIANCTAPSGFVLVNNTDSTATVRWDTTAGVQYEVQYGLGGFIAGQGLNATVQADSAVIPLIGGNVANQIYVRSICLPNDSSFWVGPLLASTPAVPCDDMEAYTPGIFQGQSSLFYSNAFFDEATIVDTKASTGNQSIHLNAFGVNGIASAAADLAIDSSSIYEIEFDLNVEINAQASVLGIASATGIGPFPTPQLAFQMSFSNNGTVAVTDESFPPTLLASFNYQQGVWEQLSVRIDLKSDTAWVLLNGLDVGAGWNYSIQNTIPKTFESILFSAPKPAFSSDVYDFFLDDFCLNTIEEDCSKPLALQGLALSCDSMEVSWNSLSGGSVLEYGPSGFSPGNGMYSGIVTSPSMLTNLMANTAYDIYVADTCGNDTSSYSSPISITTNAAPLPSIAFTQQLTVINNSMVFDGNAGASTDAVTYLWVFDGVDTLNGSQVSYTFTGNGNRTVSLQLSNACGVVDTAFTVLVNIGLREPTRSLEVLVYPNPTKNKLHIRNQGLNIGSVDITVLTMAGKRLMVKPQKAFNRNNEAILDLTHLSRGMYLLRLETEDGLGKTIRIQKQ